ncbi:HAMP domain-containing histidine kinase (plasmid) [Phaeobacter inhibens]|uniref:sensor histidine kinase n=1 Tax=Phaeobacter inhibens TaxID=221822 RepID=UPI0021A7E0AD|nr:HAMP domain-containing sensor histidine kinase [Phaeobacter inhibens]UWR78356.1 HAMP domain-containing histidine kinase [Phaeobacter inhibens]
MDAVVEIASFENAPCGFVAFDDRGKILEINARLADWLDRERADLLGSPVREILSRASRVVFETSLIPLLKMNQKIDGVSLDLVRRDGTKLPILLSGERSGTGETAVTRLVLLNAGGRRNYERELAEARATAEAQLATEAKEGELREQFVAILGHDLRNPLAALSSAIRMLAKSTTGDRERLIAAHAEDSIQRMSRLIDTTLDFARVRLGAGFELDLSGSARLGDQIQLVVHELSSANPDRKIDLDMDLQYKPSCDVWRIGQLLSNLLANALCHGDPEQPVSARVSCKEDALTISVTNKGEPIPPEMMEQLFDPFKRPKTTSKHGLGLGLFIVSEIAKAHEGEMQVASDSGTTEFSFRMPYSPDT